jgi:hypothetical protein
MTLTGKPEIRNPKSEKKSFASLFLLASCSLLLATLSGCQPAMEQLKPCEGKATAIAAIDGLNARTAKMPGLRASGQGIIEFYDEDGKLRREPFPVIIRTMPPQGLYFQGNVIVPKSVVLGTNSGEFWLWIKLKEVDSFWSGPMGGCLGGASEASPVMLLSPANILESLGYVKLDPQNPGGYAFKHNSPYDVVTMLDAEGLPARKVYIYSCDSTPRKIEYFGPGNKLMLTTRLSYYAQVTQELAVPTRIEMTFVDEKDRSQKLSITLNKDTLEVFQPTPKQATGLFTKPDPAGTKHIFRLNSDCRFEETP